MKTGFALAAGCAALLSGIVGCSSSSDTETPASSKPSASAGSAETPAVPAPPPVTAAAPDQAKVTFGANDAGPVTAIGCVTENGFTTITAEGSQATTIVLTDEDTPAVKTVGIGEVGSDSPAFAYMEGSSPTPATATRDGQKFTVTGTGLGTTAEDPMNPVDTPFDIAVTCP